MGGTSARNFLYYHRQTTGSAQKWADSIDDSTYSFPNLLEYYKKSVDYTPPTIQYTNTTNAQDLAAFTPGGGPLQVSHGAYDDAFNSWALPALQSIGQAAINGFQSGKLIGSAYVPATIDPADASRSSSESSFLRASLKTGGPTVYNNTLAERLLFVGTKATGVSVASGSQRYILEARNEVIVSAGAFQSPQLLMVSGVGPQEQLESLNIPVVAHSPGVGQNLWDQIYYGTTFRVNVPTSSAVLNDPALANAALQEYLKEARGPLSVSGNYVLGFEKLPLHLREGLTPLTRQTLDDTFPADWPELEFIPASLFLGNQSNFAVMDPRDGYNYAAIATALVAPLSRGNITIESASMADPPLINPNWLTDPADIELAIAGFKRQREVWANMSDLTIGDEISPGPQVQSDADILEFIRRNLAPVWHPAATCKMGPASDDMAVIDANAKVHGLQSLRVVDASSFPFLPPGHPQATVYALAEKIADEILRGLDSADEFIATFRD